MYKNGLIRNIRNLVQYIFLANISRSKGKQTLKFGQLIEYNLRNSFLENSYTKSGGETIPRAFSTKLRFENISGSVV